MAELSELSELQAELELSPDERDESEDEPEDESAAGRASDMNISSKALSSQVNILGTLHFSPCQSASCACHRPKWRRSPDFAAAQAEATEATGYCCASGVSCFPMRCMRMLSQLITDAVL